jgi:hypothetical protein
MSRPLVDFVQTDEIPAVQRLIMDSPVPVRCRTLCMDPHNGAVSAVVDLPAGWAMPPAQWSADLDVMVLSGTLLIGDQRLLRLGYVYVPAGVALPELRTNVPTRVVVFASMTAEPTPADDVPVDFLARCIGPVHLSDLAWEQPRTPGFPSGSGRKTLRLDEKSGQGFWVLGLLPHWDSALREWHEFAEENFVLAGEIETAVGLMTPGAYLSHPPGREYIHGPMRSRPGALVITRSVGPFATSYEPAPAGVALSGPWP